MKTKISIVLVVFILLNIFFMNPVWAVQLDAIIDKKEIKAGENIKLVIKTKDIGEKEVNLLQGKLVYDRNDWEVIKKETIKAKSNWSIIYNDEEGNSEGEFLMISFNGKTNEEEICEIELKSKKRLISTESEIRLINLNTTDGEQMIELQDVSEQIEIKGKENILILIGIGTIGLIVLVGSIIRNNKK